MKKSRKGTIAFSVVVVGAILLLYSYFHVSGREIENAEKISADACTVTIVRYQHMEWEGRKEYRLGAAQIEELKNLILKSSFTKDLSGAVIFKDRDMYDIRVKFDNGQDFIGIDCIGNEYITVWDQFDGKHLKVNNPNWKATLEGLIESAEAQEIKAIK